MSRLGRALGVGGCVTIAAAIAWWWITFGEVVTYGYLTWGEAGNCLLHGSDICSLATALCLGSHPRLLIAYWSSTLWIGLMAISASPLLGGRAKAP